MRTVYLGTSAFAAAVLERLAASPHRPALVVTRPDRPRGRGRHPAPPPCADAAQRLEIELIAPERPEEALDAIAAIGPEAVCVCAYGAILREPLLSSFPMLNVHPSLLPRWRGAAPIERAIMAGDAETGVSIMHVVSELDAGPIAAQQREPIAATDTYGTLAARLAQLGADLLISALERNPQSTPQDHALATYAEKIAPSDRVLDGARTAVELERAVRALAPHIVARTADGLRVHAAAVADGDSALPAPGKVAAIDGRLFLGCTDGGLELLRVQPPSGREMDAAAYLRGHPV